MGPVKDGSQWYVSDRTHLVALRGTVKAEYFTKANVAGVTDSKSVPVRHTVNARVTILNKPDLVTKSETSVGVVSVVEADSDLMIINELYAQVGILAVPI